MPKSKNLDKITYSPALCLKLGRELRRDMLHLSQRQGRSLTEEIREACRLHLDRHARKDERAS